VASVKVAKKAFDIALVLWRCFMVRSFEFGVTNEGFAMFAPVFGRRFPVLRHRWLSLKRLVIRGINGQCHVWKYARSPYGGLGSSERDGRNRSDFECSTRRSDYC